MAEEKGIENKTIKVELLLSTTREVEESKR